ncbi:MAG: hypothetical protein RLZZ360_359 [Candidatus Parcubacteria bacterium]|jgi:hypothetical protein
MRIGLFLSIFSFVCLVPMMVPSVAVAQISLAEYAGCSGTDCSACNLVDLANGLIKWLIGFLFLIFAVILTYAGVGLVTSGGNHHALDEAKNRFVNALIGLMIVLAAWLIVDTIMRGLVGQSGAEGQIPTGGDVSGWLYWSEVQCYTQKTPTPKTFTPNVFEPNTFWPGDSGSAGGQIVSESPCASTPAGNVNCIAAEASCRAQGLQPIINTENPTNYLVSCVQVGSSSNGADGTGGAGSGSSGCSGGTCIALTIPCSARGCTIAPDMVSRLERMHNTAGVSGARVTEAMPPSRQHKSACHSNGTCVDYSKSGGMSASEVSRVVTAASANGLRAVYEVQTQSQKDSLVSAGVSAGNILVLGSWISAPHFSIYGY